MSKPYTYPLVAVVGAMLVVLTMAAGQAAGSDISNLLDRAERRYESATDRGERRDRVREIQARQRRERDAERREEYRDRYETRDRWDNRNDRRDWENRNDRRDWNNRREWDSRDHRYDRDNNRRDGVNRPFLRNY